MQCMSCSIVEESEDEPTYTLKPWYKRLFHRVHTRENQEIRESRESNEENDSNESEVSSIVLKGENIHKTYLLGLGILPHFIIIFRRHSCSSWSEYLHQAR